MKYILILIIGLTGNGATFSADRPIGLVVEKIEFQSLAVCNKAAKALLDNAKAYSKNGGSIGSAHFYQAKCIEIK